MDLPEHKKQEQEKDFNQEINIAIGQELNYFGEALVEHWQSYPKLKKIASYKINPQYEDSNYQQQAGFSAEVKQTARLNAENIINKNPARVSRTDDIGAVNHPQFDYVNVDENNMPILDSAGNFTGGVQQKNFGSLESYNKLLNKKGYYHYQDAQIVIPSDQYEQVISMWNDEISNLQLQSQELRLKGKFEKANEIEVQIRRIEDVKSRTTASKVSSAEAMEGRKTPLISVGKDSLRVIHRSGVEFAKYGTALGSSISVVKNVYDVIHNGKDAGEAVVSIASDTAKSAGISYVAGAGSATISCILKSSGNQICKLLARGCAPVVIFNTGVILAKQSYDLLLGKITSAQFVENIGQEGMTLAASVAGANLGATIGTMVFPGAGTIIGGLLGGIIASMMSCTMYQELKRSIATNNYSEEHRKAIELLCNDLIEKERQYRKMVDECLTFFLKEKENQISSSFNVVFKAIESGTSIQPGLELLAKAFNQNLPFNSDEEFIRHLDSGDTLML